MTSNVKFTPKFENGCGILYISGSNLSVDKLPDFWAAYKKCIEEEHKLNIYGAFYKIGTHIKCVFMLNTVYRHQEVSDEQYRNSFEQKFESWILGFISLLKSVMFDVEHAHRHTEESEEDIQDRIFRQRTAALKIYVTMYDNDSKKQVQANRARRKAADAKRKAKARAKKATQQNSSHTD